MTWHFNYLGCKIIPFKNIRHRFVYDILIFQDVVDKSVSVLATNLKIRTMDNC